MSFQKFVPTKQSSERMSDGEKEMQHDDCRSFSKSQTVSKKRETVSLRGYMTEKNVK